MFLLGAGLACGEPGELVLDIDLVLGSEEDEAEYFFGTIASVVEDSRGNIYVVDASQMSVLKFQPDGEYLGRMGQAGEGPTDLMRFLHLTIDAHDHIHFTGMGERVEIVDLDWQPVDAFARINVENIANSLAVFDDGGTVIVSPNTSQHTSLDLYDASHQHILSFSDTYAVDLDLPARIESVFSGGSVAITTREEILYLQRAPYVVRVFDRAGVLLRSTSTGGEDVVDPPEMPEIKGESVSYRSLSSSTGLVSLPDGEILTTAYRFIEDEHRQSYCFFHDENLTLLGRYEQPGFLMAKSVSHNGSVYFAERTESGNRVLRAKVMTKGTH